MHSRLAGVDASCNGLLVQKAIVLGDGFRRQGCCIRNQMPLLRAYTYSIVAWTFFLLQMECTLPLTPLSCTAAGCVYGVRAVAFTMTDHMAAANASKFRSQEQGFGAIRAMHATWLVTNPALLLPG